MKYLEKKVFRLTDFGVVEITVKVRTIHHLAIVNFYDRDYTIGTVLCEAGSFEAFIGFNFILETYFKSVEFEQNRKEGGSWN